MFICYLSDKISLNSGDNGWGQRHITAYPCFNIFLEFKKRKKKKAVVKATFRLLAIVASSCESWALT